MTIDLHIQTYFKNYIYFNSGTEKQKPPVKDKAYLDEIFMQGSTHSVWTGKGHI